MEKQLLSLLGNSFKHVLGGIIHALRAIIIAGLATAVAVGGATEAIGSAVSQQFPPAGLTHLAAAALALAFGYAAAITVAIEEILRTIIKAFELVIQEAEKLGKEAITEAEKLGRSAVHDAGAVGRTVITDAGALSRGVTGVVGGVIGGVGHEAHAIEQGMASHLPGHHNSVGGVSSTAPTVPSGGSTN
jgi:hypothetical protein